MVSQIVIQIKERAIEMLALKCVVKVYVLKLLVDIRYADRRRITSLFIVDDSNIVIIAIIYNDDSL